MDEAHICVTGKMCTIKQRHGEFYFFPAYDSVATAKKSRERMCWNNYKLSENYGWSIVCVSTGTNMATMRIL